ncbi:MAG: type II secretion system protein [Gammaproteobacteria bacterium]|nr:type II secretion system protein [Gammaproteobacteria bacterium]
MQQHLEHKHIAPRGFTLLEMVAVISITAIIAVGIVSYIADAATGYDAAASRNKLAQSGRIALDRLSIELHNSLPNSLRVTPATAAGEQCIEFIPVIGATTYVNPPLFLPSTEFSVVQFSPNLESATGGYVAIYPTQENEVYDAEYATATGFPAIGPIEAVSNIDDTIPSTTQLSRVTLQSSHRFSEPSPNSRLFYIQDPVSYCLRNNKLYRYTDYGFYSVQTAVEAEAGVCVVASGDRCLPSASAGGSRLLITNNVSNAGRTAFKLIPQTLARNALVSIDLRFESQGEFVALNNQVLMRSVP